MIAVDAVAAVLLLMGCLLALLAGLGLQQFDSVFARMHAATKAITLGVLLVVLAASLRLGEAAPTSKLLLVAVFQFITAPIAAHMVGRASYRSGTELSPRTQVDELAKRQD